MKLGDGGLVYLLALLGLLCCGLIAAGLGRDRRRLGALSAAAKQRDVIRAVLRGWSPSGPLELQLDSALKAAQRALPLAGAVVRDAHDRVLASCDPADGLRTLPRAVLEPEALVPSPRRGGRPFSFELPREGGRVALGAAERPIGWLDVWGNGGSANAEAAGALTDLACLIALLLAADPRSPGRAAA